MVGDDGRGIILRLLPFGALCLTGCALFLRPGGAILLPPSIEVQSPAIADDGLPWKVIAPGCDLWTFDGRFEDSAQRVFVIRADLADPRVRLVVTAGDAKRTLSEFRDELKASAVAANVVACASVNGTVLGCVADGRIFSAPAPRSRAEASAPYWFVWGGQSAAIRPLLIEPASVGQPAPDGITGGVCSYPAGAAPVLWEGRPYDAAGAPESGIAIKRNPRTIVGVDEEGRAVYLVIIQGRRPEGVGMTLAEAGRFLTQQQPRLHSAINLDGGYSSLLIVDDDALGEPVAPQRARRIPNALHVLVTPAGAGMGGPTRHAE